MTSTGVARYRDLVNRAGIAGWSRQHPLLTDTALGVLAVGLSTATALFGPRAVIQSLNLLEIALIVFCVAAITLRRRYPLIVFGAIAGATLLVVILGANATVGGGALLVAAWTVGLRCSRSVSLIAGGAVSVALLLRALLGEGIDGLRAENVNPLILVLLAIAGGIAVRDRRAYLQALVDRAERAELTRETEAARRVAEERLRIARDLHDSLAHHMAVVNVQTGVAQHLLTADPAAASEALGHARTAAGQVLDELGTVLGVLRAQADGESTEPAPSLAQLSALIAPLRSAGMELRVTVSGLPRDLPPAVDQAAYRLAQEALTNVQKHAAGSKVWLTVDYRDQAVALEIVNSAVDGHRPGGSEFAGSEFAGSEAVGFGLAGMRERSAAVDGLLETGPVAGQGFRVFALLPAPIPAGPAPTGPAPARPPPAGPTPAGTVTAGQVAR